MSVLFRSYFRYCMPTDYGRFAAAAPLPPLAVHATAAFQLFLRFR